MATRRTRRTRVTLRCVREDLELGIPPVEVDLGALDHPLVAEARRVAPAAPRGQKRILAIEHPLVYRLRHARDIALRFGERRDVKFGDEFAGPRERIEHCPPGSRR